MCVYLSTCLSQNCHFNDLSTFNHICSLYVRVVVAILLLLQMTACLQYIFVFKLRCFLDVCPDLANISNGQMRYYSGFTPKDFAAFSCEDGYSLEGPSTIECLFSNNSNTSNWNRDPPKCVRNGKVSDSYSYKLCAFL